jgi:hypothetical protein
MRIRQDRGTTLPVHATDRRSSDRQRLVLRVGLLEQESRSIFCLVKNISSAGILAKPYGTLIPGIGAALRVGDEDAILGTVVWEREGLAGMKFKCLLDQSALLRVVQKMVASRRRSIPRLSTDLHACVRTGGRAYRARLSDLSLRGARLSTRHPVCFGESTTLDLPGLPRLKSYVRWTDGSEFGVSFDVPLPMQVIANLVP